MTITELIVNLQRMRREYGDIEVRYHDDYEGGSLEIKEVIPCRPHKVGEWVEDETQPPYCVEIN